MSHTVQRAESSDFIAIAALDRIAWADAPFIPDGEHVWRVWCEHSTVLVVREDGAAKGDETGDIAAALVMFCTDDGALFLHKIMAHPDHRGRGMGTALMRAALERAREVGAPVLLTVDPQNTRAAELYRQFGFEVREHVKGYYRPHEHRDVMVFTPEPAR